MIMFLLSIGGAVYFGRKAWHAHNSGPDGFGPAIVGLPLWDRTRSLIFGVIGACLCAGSAAFQLGSVIFG
ncbi:MAG TPA: hypothetical protein VNS19_21925 [Acidimicrobiales bacterium]|nr:hypothetical protein [Acidimicrobiales bacterium]